MATQIINTDHEALCRPVAGVLRAAFGWGGGGERLLDLLVEKRFSGVRRYVGMSLHSVNMHACMQISYQELKLFSKRVY